MTDETGEPNVEAVRNSDDYTAFHGIETDELVPPNQGTKQTRRARSLIMARVNLNSCPRCDGAVLDYIHSVEDSPLCMMCGWRDQTVSPSVLAEVESHLGKSFIEHTYTHSKATRGKPPMSGWDREKNRRAQMKMSATG